MPRIIMVKDGSTKNVEDKWKKDLEKLGWRVQGEKKPADPEKDEMEALWVEAKALGLELHHKTGKEKLKEAIEKAKA